MFEATQGHSGRAGPLHDNEATPRTRTNRLSRTLRKSPQTRTKSPKCDLKTPTRTSRSSLGSTLSSQSPQDCEVHHDIIWDATSPLPHRLGKRGKKHAGVVSISDIVSRIAPEHGRPRVSEPTLQQWIGDSAAIPCTPDVQPPKSRRKSPRSNGVDELLKLAKRFDLSWFHGDEEEADQNRECVLASGRESDSERAGAELEQLADLDFLFDEPSQLSSRVPGPSEPAGKCPVMPCHVANDWEDDDLLNDSVLVEMTQNVEKLGAPQHCSTQVGAPALSQSEGRTTLASSADFLSFRRLSSAGRGVSDRSRDVCHSPTSVAVSMATGNHFPEDDLDSFFSSEPLWDDPAEDQLLCELCEDVENRIQHVPGHYSSAPPATGSGQVQDSSGSSKKFTFKKPSPPVAMATSKDDDITAPAAVAARCSAAEIQLKKQQALERRQRRLREVQNLQEPGRNVT
ncbi:ewing's tumor-associated antigen 1 isoform X1 [Nerophis lumbriciformis]|uniref:ewing's tumor-associated antigen 1 isoform X1 n=1 Tax=Nerophis lumbriciformis TaxID=546530 RepID=UPI002ADF59D3|nr:uncharacterized protein LOC133624281 isoform X1 [Nerophis lumbriciformis]